MAYRVFKESAGVGRLVALWRIYNFINDVAETQWSVIYTNGNFATADGAGLVDGDYFVCRCSTASPGGVYGEVLIAATAGATTFGGAADNAYVLPLKSFGVIYSPDGGWDAGTKLFAPSGGLAAVYKTSQDTHTTFYFKLSMSTHINHLQVFMGHGTSVVGTTVDKALYAGVITSYDTSDTKACAIMFGKPLATNVSGNWGNAGGGYVAVPNSSWTSWEGGYLEFGQAFSSVGRTKNGDKYVEFPCYVFTDGGKTAGELVMVKKIDSALANYSVSGDGTRVVANGLTFSWVSP
jgi:hypothetical protein